jgi:hypothetical protein
MSVDYKELVNLARATDGLSIAVETVTPMQAESWLKREGPNRPLNSKRVAALAAAMHRGEWRLTGEAIKLDKNGNLRDGQHRLWAVFKSGVSIQSVVVRGVSEDSFDVMDTGRQRTIADVLGMHGAPFRNALGAAVRLLEFYERYGDFEPTNRESQTIMTPVSTLRYLDLHPEVENGVRLGDRIRGTGLIGGGGMWGALFTIFSRLDVEMAHQFAYYLSSGADMSAGHPVLLLRNRLMIRKEATGRKAVNRTDRQQVAALAILAWNAFRRHKTISTLYFRGDGPKPQAFPTAI